MTQIKDARDLGPMTEDIIVAADKIIRSYSHEGTFAVSLVFHQADGTLLADVALSVGKEGDIRCSRCSTFFEADALDFGAEPLCDHCIEGVY